MLNNTCYLQYKIHHIITYFWFAFKNFLLPEQNVFFCFTGAKHDQEVDKNLFWSIEIKWRNNEYHLVFQYFKRLFSFLSTSLKIHVTFGCSKFRICIFLYVIKRQLLGLASNKARQITCKYQFFSKYLKQSTCFKQVMYRVVKKLLGQAKSSNQESASTFLVPTPTFDSSP